jgi:hypothetical protein
MTVVRYCLQPFFFDVPQLCQSLTRLQGLLKVPDMLNRPQIMC